MGNSKFLNWDKLLLILLGALLVVFYSRLVPSGLGNVLLAAVSIIGTLPVLLSAFRSIKEKRISVDLLASIALIASLLTGEWASAVFINLMLTSARIFGDYTEAKAKAAIKSLLKLRPDKVKVKREGKILDISVREVRVGDMVVVESGERIPVDGSVLEGEASIDQSSLTGESVPVGKSKGDKVFSSTLAVSGSLTIRADKVGENTTLEKIISLVESSQNEKASIRTTADKFAAWYIVLTLAASLVIYIVFQDMNLLLSLLLVACADDIAIAIPMAFLAAVGYAARRGVIIKGGNYLEGLTKVKTFIMDKTGTITRGKMKVEGFLIYNGYSENELLAFAGMTEFFSDHPVARAIADYVKDKKIKFEKPLDFEEKPGKGIASVYKGKTIYSGKVKFLEESGIKITPKEREDITRMQDEGYSVTLVGYEGKLVGILNCADEIRPHVKEIIEKMKKFGVEKVVMLTGDNEKVAKRIASEAGITHFHANLLPENKIEYVKRYLSPDSKVAMVGDGVNDAASLALADVGIAMGAIGSDAAIEAADIALMRDDLREIPETMELGLYTRRVARQDFWIWGVVNALGLILVFARIIGPNGSAAYNFVTDFLPLINSLRLFNLHLKL
ncbi:MAG: cation-translocating P-type ATPase [Minisyncoccia bacterium]|jgi:Cd2+/Zn2+-exporting ATPase